VIKVNKNQRFPADLILLKSSDASGIAYVETMSLDGETNLKHKSAILDM
jgi:magnesium-transporting ATPase (P-type)